MGEVLRVIHQRVDDYFEITDRGSTVPTEIRGGLVSFLTMSYILLVNPNILTAWIDYDPDHLKEDYGKDIATATAITCGLGSILVGVLARMPFAIGPGMGLNTFVAALYSAATSKGDLADAKNTFGVVSATTFVAGVILLVISAANLVSPAVNAMPMTMKTAIMVGIGAFQAFVGMREMGIVVSDSTNLVNLEEFPSFIWQHRGEYNSGYAQLLFVIGLLLTTVLFMKRVKGSILLGIFLVTALSWAMNIGGGKLPVPPVGVPELSHTWATVDFAGWVRNAKKFAPQTFVILLITIFDCGGVLFGIGQLLNLPAKYAAAAEKKRESARVINGNIVQHGTGNNGLVHSGLAKASYYEDGDEAESNTPLLDEDKHAAILPGRCSQMTFLSVALSNMIGAMLGSSPCIVFLECATGVQDGACTGLASVVTGSAFLLTTFFTPTFQKVPICASAGPLIFIGCLMMSHVGDINWKSLDDALPAFLCICMMPFTSSITPSQPWGGKKEDQELEDADVLAAAE